jgi:hypothetical protein
VFQGGVVSLWRSHGRLGIPFGLLVAGLLLARSWQHRRRNRRWVGSTHDGHPG